MTSPRLIPHSHAAVSLRAPGEAPFSDTPPRRVIRQRSIRGACSALLRPLPTTPRRPRDFAAVRQRQAGPHNPLGMSVRLRPAALFGAISGSPRRDVCRSRCHEAAVILHRRLPRFLAGPELALSSWLEFPVKGNVLARPVTGWLGHDCALISRKNGASEGVAGWETRQDQ